MFGGMSNYVLVLLVAAASVLITLVAYFLLGGLKKKGYRNRVEELEIFKYEISNKPVLFELAKLKSVKKSDRIVSLVGVWEGRWQDLEEQIGTVSENLAYAEELIITREFEGADEVIEATRGDLTNLSEKIEVLLEEINTLKSSESRNRVGVVDLRESFDFVKTTYEEKKEDFSFAAEKIDQTISTINELFDKFDENMEESNYDLADEASELIKEKLDILSNLFERAPMYLESIEDEIKPLLEGVLESHDGVARAGIYLEHLKVASVVTTLRKDLDAIPALIGDFDFASVEAKLVAIPERAKELREAIKREFDLKEVLEVDLETLNLDFTFIVAENLRLMESYDSIKESCLMSEDDEDNFHALNREIGMVKTSITGLLEGEGVADKATSIYHQEILDALAQTKEIKEQLKIFDIEIEKLHAGAKESKKRAIELLSELNELKALFERTIFEGDVKPLQSYIDRGSKQVNALLNAISQVPIDVENVTKELEVTEETMTSVRENVNLKIEQLRLAERLVVYGNRYTGTGGMYLMDLTIAEDQFKQGNYQSVIEKMYKLLPGIEGDKFYTVLEGLKKELGCQML